MDASLQKPKNSTIIGGILLVLVMLFALSLMGTTPVLNFFGLAKVNETYYFISRLLFWVCVMITMIYAMVREKVVIWRQKSYSGWILLLSIVGVLAAFFISNIITGIILHLFVPKEKSVEMDTLMNIFKTNTPLYIFTAFTAGVCEELLFRGYLQARLQMLLKSPVAAIIISSLLFGLMHYRYGTIVNMVGPFFIGLVAATYYYKFKNINVLIISHFLWDMAAIYIVIHQH